MKSSKKHILIIDDDRAVCASLKLLMGRAGFEVSIANYPKEALEFLNAQRPDLILLDLNFNVDTSGKQGLKLLEEIQGVDASIPVIMMTGWGTLQLAVRGMKSGARDFITKPWDNKELLASVKTILELDNPTKAVSKNHPGFEGIIGQDPAFLEVLEKAKRISGTNASVLILGESGTGKELLAEAIHYESNRPEQAFVKVNLGGISSTLFESEMFGHKKGAFTDARADRKGRFEMADRGTIFLDEIGDLDPGSQVKLLRVLQEKTFEILGSSKPQKVDVRVISATNKDLQEMVREGSFREDLFYRINLISLTLPSLKERRSDIPLLVDHYVRNLGEIYGMEELSVSKGAIKWLMNQEFEGNIRQLKNLVERTILLSGKTELDEDDFKANHFEDLSRTDMHISTPAVGEMSIEEMEKEMILKALSYHNYKINKAALSLGITRSALYRRMNKFNIAHDS